MATNELCRHYAYTSDRMKNRDTWDVQSVILVSGEMKHHRQLTPVRLSPVGPGGNAQQVDREARPAGAQGPRRGRAAQVEFVLRLQLQGVVESAHHSHGQPSEHLLQNLLRKIQTGSGPGGLLLDPVRTQQRRQVQQHQDADPIRTSCHLLNVSPILFKWSLTEQIWSLRPSSLYCKQPAAPEESERHVRSSREFLQTCSHQSHKQQMHYRRETFKYWCGINPGIKSEKTHIPLPLSLETCA